MRRATHPVAARGEAERTSDPDLLRQLAGGEIGALGELYDRYREPVRRFIARATSDAEDVDDLVHATFLAAAKIASRYDGRASLPSLAGRDRGAAPPTAAAIARAPLHGPVVAAVHPSHHDRPSSCMASARGRGEGARSDQRGQANHPAAGRSRGPELRGDRGGARGPDRDGVDTTARRSPRAPPGAGEGRRVVTPAACPRLFEVEAARDGRLAGAELASFERHMTGCPACLHEAKALEGLADALRAGPRDAGRPGHVARATRANPVARRVRPRPGEPRAPLGRSAAAARVGSRHGSRRRHPRSVARATGRAARARERRRPRRQHRGVVRAHGRQPRNNRPQSRRAMDPRRSLVGERPAPRRAPRWRARRHGDDVHGKRRGGPHDARRGSRGERGAPAPWPAPCGHWRGRHMDSRDTASGIGLRERCATRGGDRPIRGARATGAERAAVTRSASAERAASHPVALHGGAGARVRRSTSAPQWLRSTSATTQGRQRPSRAFVVKHPHDPRAEDAAYLRVIALQRSGDSGSVRWAAQEYLRRYPEGFRRAEMQALAR